LSRVSRRHCRGTVSHLLAKTAAFIPANSHLRLQP
jgi:hypothetical protein